MVSKVKRITMYSTRARTGKAAFGHGVQALNISDGDCSICQRESRISFAMNKITFYHHSLDFAFLDWAL
jgi:hypothetical protein